MKDSELLTDSQQQWVNKTLSSLTLREKIGQTIQEICSEDFCSNADAAREHFGRYPYGSLFTGGEIIKGAGSSAAIFHKSIGICQQASKIPLLVAGDLEHGVGAAVKDMTRFPVALSLGATDDEQLAYDYGRYTALEGHSAGFNWTFSPVVDLLQNWLNPIVSNRSMGDNPKAVTRMASAISRGLQEHGMAACAKHFPGDGVDFRDQHLVTSINSLSEAQWWEQHGAVFQSMIDAGVHTIMAGHIALPWFEPMEPGQKRPRPATVSKRLLTDLLRGVMGFDGVVVSDALIMGGYTGWAGEEERLIESFNAGVDVMLWPGKPYFELIERAIASGKVSMQRLDESVRRVLTLKVKLGLIEALNPAGQSKPDVLAPEIRTQAKELSRKVAEKGLTLVRNRENVLPLDLKKVKRVLVHKAVPAEVDPAAFAHLKYFTDLLESRGLELTILENGNCLDIQKREQQGERWDAYLVIYSLQNHQMKNTVRPTGKMGEVMWMQQNTNTLQPITISLNTPFLLNDMPFLETLVNAYGTSTETMDALNKALFGEIDFSRYSPVKIEEETWVLGK